MAYRLPASVLCQELGGEAVLLQLNTEHYHQLDAMGVEMLTLLKEHSEPETVALLLERYEVDPQRLKRDLADFIEGLTRRGLLERA